MKIFLLTDLEGISGIVDWDMQGNWNSPFFQDARKFMTGEANAAIEGLLEAGADDIVVCDGHGGAYCNFNFEDLNPAARLLIGDMVYDLEGLDASFDAMILIGTHAMEGTQRGILSHTMSSRTYANLWVNDRAINEAMLWGYLAGDKGVPLVMISGDRWAIEESKEVLGGIEYVAVKEGLSRRTAVNLHPQKARELVKAAARRAVALIGKVPPLQPAKPVTFTVEYRDTADADRAVMRKGATRIDGRRVFVKGGSFTEVWLRLR